MRKILLLFAIVIFSSSLYSQQNEFLDISKRTKKLIESKNKLSFEDMFSNKHDCCPCHSFISACRLVSYSHICVSEKVRNYLAIQAKNKFILELINNRLTKLLSL